jgi:glycine/D-amino acid oxidase-like deaminating enzyme
LQYLDARQAAELLPIARFDDAALISFEPEAGFADAYLVATSFARAARRRGVTVKEGVSVERLLIENGRAGADQCRALPQRHRHQHAEHLDA